MDYILLPHGSPSPTLRYGHFTLTSNLPTTCHSPTLWHCPYLLTPAPLCEQTDRQTSLKTLPSLKPRMRAVMDACMFTVSNLGFHGQIWKNNEGLLNSLSNWLNYFNLRNPLVHVNNQYKAKASTSYFLVERHGMWEIIGSIPFLV